ncbi:MAG TPA: SGNH/GDSL hydrolase family protein [Sneathiellales bacterium]|jgi:lysophospholipase L1-like esterase|nr:SGNH/GDSL hydrolase family protein [Sneathiellales bacterium]
MIVIRALQNTGLTVGAILISLAGAEVALRLAGFPNFLLYDPMYEEAPPPITYVLKLNFTGLGRGGIPIRTNSSGMRADREFEQTPNPDVYRIALIGDSFTFGHRVVVENTYGAKLEHSLNGTGRGRSWEVLNFGISGYNAQRMVELFKKRVRHYKPKLVIFSIIHNTFSSGRSRMRFTSPGYITVPGATLSGWPRLQLVLRRFHVVSAAKLLLTDLSTLIDGMHSRARGPSKEGKYQGDKRREFVQGIKSACEEFEGRCVIAFIDLNQTLPSMKLVKGLALENGIEFWAMDRTGVMPPLSDIKLDYDYHPNVAGHTFIASNLYAHITRQ